MSYLTERAFSSWPVVSCGQDNPDKGAGLVTNNSTDNRTAEGGEVLTVAALAERLQVSSEAVRKRIARGKLEAWQGVSGRWNIPWPQPDNHNRTKQANSTGQPDSPKVEAAVLAERVRGLEQQLAEAKAERDHWREAHEKVLTALDQQQRLALPAAAKALAASTDAGEGQHRGFWQWFVGR